MTTDDVWVPPAAWSSAPALERSMVPPVASAVVNLATDDAMADTVARIRADRPWTRPVQSGLPALFACAAGVSLGFVGLPFVGLLVAIAGAAASLRLGISPHQAARAQAREHIVDILPGCVVVRARHHRLLALPPDAQLEPRANGSWLRIPGQPRVALLGAQAQSGPFTQALLAERGKPPEYPGIRGLVARVTPPSALAYATLSTTRRYATITARSSLALVVTFFIAAVFIVWFLTASAMTALALSAVASLLVALVTLIPIAQFPLSYLRGRHLAAVGAHGMTVGLGSTHLVVLGEHGGVAVRYKYVQCQQVDGVTWVRADSIRLCLPHDAIAHETPERFVQELVQRANGA